MIAIACTSCAKRLTVKEELAGKKVRCPTCKQAIVVPVVTIAVQPVPERSFANDETVAPRESSSPWPSDPITGPSSVPNDEDAEAVEAKTAYHISSEIARGGMGAIMRAVEQGIQREVAVKFLLNAADAKQKARFVEEAQITGQLEHPNIVPIHQLGEHDDGRCFFSMKMVKGRSLAEILKDETSSYTLSRLLGVFVNICNAMAYALSRNVIHRDLKPANIMVGDFGEVYVMDWGLAKVIHPGEPTAPDDPAHHRMPEWSESAKVTTQRQGELTQAGAIMGTPAYMPPEQAKGDDVDPRADIYSLGAILYQMMTLTPPVGREGDMLAILMRVVEGQIDPPVKRSPSRAKSGWIPPELSAIAMKALAKDREDRYQTVEDLRRDVELFLEGRSVSAKQDSVREQVWKLIKRNQGVSIAMAAALVMLAAVLTVAFRVNIAARLDAEDQKDRAELANAKSEKSHAEFQKEQGAKEKVIRQSIPAMIRAGRQLANEGYAMLYASKSDTSFHVWKLWVNKVASFS